MIVNYKGKEAKVPDFMIVGAAKSGTTSLHHYLGQHPEIFMPKVKELFFFSFMDSPPNLSANDPLRGRTVHRLEDYIEHFKAAKENQIVGESCPSYLYTYKNTIRNVKTVYQEKYIDLKIIIVLRNPAERAWSHFTMKKNYEQEPLDNFKEAVGPELVDRRLKEGWNIGYDYIGFGMYYEQVKAFLEEFPHVKLLLYDDFCNDAMRVFSRKKLPQIHIPPR